MKSVNKIFQVLNSLLTFLQVIFKELWPEQFFRINANLYNGTPVFDTETESMQWCVNFDFVESE